MYPGQVAGETDPIARQVAELRQRLEAEIDDHARPFRGCWPLLVGLAGVLLAAALLFELL